MSYRVDRFNGTFLVSVADGTIDTTTDLRLIGKNYAGYGEVQNENFLHLLENFANITPPPKAVPGQLWYDSTGTIKKLKFYDGDQWKSAAGATVSVNSPSNLTAGDFWFDLTTNQLYVWNGGTFVLVGPENIVDITSTSILPADLRDSTGTPYKVLKVNVDTNTVAIISDNVFTINQSTTPVIGFSRIRKGINLVNTQNESGITDNVNDRFWGTASNSDRLGQLLPSAYVTQEQLGVFPDSGYRIGSKYRAFVENSNFPVLENVDFSNPNNSITFRIRTDAGNRDSLVIKREGIFPSLDSQFSIGSESLKWLNVYSDNFIGNLFGNSLGTHKGDLVSNTDVLHFDADTGNFFGIFGSPSDPGTFFGNFAGDFTGDLNGTAARALSIAGFTVSEQVPSEPIGIGRVTIPLRDTQGNLYATSFVGTADRANLLLVGSTYRSTSLTPDNNTIAARDQFGDIQANVFRGVATSARYADLAEKYLPDQTYFPGTVVSVGGEKEITASRDGDRAIGIISQNPAFKMNSDLEDGVYVALKGRVPVRVVGDVKKGDRLVAADGGCARAVKGDLELINVFAIALSNSIDSEVEAVVL
jgi:hypothetical protein